MNIDSLGIRYVGDTKDRCCVCGDVAMGCYFDDDIARITAQERGHVCHECAGFVIVAEAILHGCTAEEAPTGGWIFNFFKKH
jgi:hypothetical protein